MSSAFHVRDLDILDGIHILSSAMESIMLDFIDFPSDLGPLQGIKHLESARRYLMSQADSSQ